MARDDRIRMPSSGGGLINYYEEYESKIKFKPIYIIAFIIFIIILELILHKTKFLG